jgi:hypothetical protein
MHDWHRTCLFSLTGLPHCGQVHSCVDSVGAGRSPCARSPRAARATLLFRRDSAVGTVIEAFVEASSVCATSSASGETAARSGGSSPAASVWVGAANSSPQ